MATNVHKSSPFGTDMNTGKITISILFAAVNQKHKCSVFCSRMVFIMSSFMDIHRTVYLGLLLLLYQHEDAGSPEVPHEGEQVESAEKGESGKKDGSDVTQDTGNVEGQHMIDEARKSSGSEEKPSREEGDLKPGEGNAGAEAKKDDTDGEISKSVDNESRKSRMSGEGERDITEENGEDETKNFKKQIMTKRMKQNSLLRQKMKQNTKTNGRK
jgi:hypothetical protein